MCCRGGSGRRAVLCMSFMGVHTAAVNVCVLGDIWAEEVLSDF